MTKIKEIFFSKKILSLGLLFLVSALVYLPLIDKFGYTHDDWYLMYAAKVKGAAIFREAFIEDRPLRAWVMMPAYTIFGDNPLYFNFSAYFFRLLSGIGFLWTVQLLWVKQRSATLWMALLFLIYPGFLSQPNGIDYQSQMVALAAATFSLALTLKSLSASNIFVRSVFVAVAALLAWLYLGLVEYFIGIEVLRFLLLFTVALRSEGTFFKKAQKAFVDSVPFLLAPLPFVFWRFFLFDSERGATNIGAQLSGFSESPLLVSATWFINLVHDAIKTLFLAWGVPLSSLAFGMRIKETATGFSLGAIVVLLVIAVVFLLRKNEKSIGDAEVVHPEHWQKEAVWLGFLTLTAGLLPITLVNRSVIFPSHSRYTLAASIGVVFILVAISYFFANGKLRITVLSILIFIATLTHYANAVSFSQETAALQDFWWQVSWRIPHIAQETTLIANYPNSAIEEEYFVWGPANQIYYPEGTSRTRVRPGVYAFVLTHDTVLNILTQQINSPSIRRGTIIYADYRDILILTQPTTNSCVHVIDGSQPEYSQWEDGKIMQIGDYSDATRILADAASHTPPEIIFGAEPAHGWCYFYEMAALARQRGDWAKVYALDTEASQQGSVAKDPVEWMPFLQSYIHFDDVERLTKVSKTIKNNFFVRKQACEILQSMPEISPEAAAVVDVKICTQP